MICQKTFILPIVTPPPPVITSISPNTKYATDPAFVLTVNGSGFVPTSQIQWNGVAVGGTVYVSAAQLTVTIPAPDIASPAVNAVTVFNPPASQTSNTVNLTVTTFTPPPSVTIGNFAALNAAWTAWNGDSIASPVMPFTGVQYREFSSFDEVVLVITVVPRLFQSPPGSFPNWVFQKTDNSLDPVGTYAYLGGPSQFAALGTIIITP